MSSGGGGGDGGDGGMLLCVSIIRLSISHLTESS